MMGERQSGLSKWENIKRGGFWRFVALRGVLGFGVPMSIFGIIFERAWKNGETLLILGICLIGGFVWGLGMWIMMNRIYERRTKKPN